MQLVPWNKNIPVSILLPFFLVNTADFLKMPPCSHVSSCCSLCHSPGFLNFPSRYHPALLSLHSAPDLSVASPLLSTLLLYSTPGGWSAEVRQWLERKLSNELSSWAPQEQKSEGDFCSILELLESQAVSHCADLVFIFSAYTSQGLHDSRSLPLQPSPGSAPGISFDGSCELVTFSQKSSMDKKKKERKKSLGFM